uniref:Uncharacterized protein n=1 Tax=Rhodnius prolixus TaxID=13249 RepID=T1HM35_RHOPR
MDKVQEWIDNNEEEMVEPAVEDEFLVITKPPSNIYKDGTKEVTYGTVNEPLLQIRRLDIKKVLKKLKELHKKWLCKEHEERLWYLDKENILLSANNHYMDDIIFFCFIYTVKGTSMYRIIEKSHGDLKEILIHLTLKYEIPRFPISVDGKVSDDLITLERIVRCYPDICCNFYAEGKFHRIIDENVIGNKVEGKRRALLCTLFPSVACTSLLKKQTNIIPQLLWIDLKTMQVLSNNKHFSINHLWFKLKQTLNVHFIPEEVKQSLCKEWKLIDANGNPDLLFEKTRNNCLVYLAEEFRHDENWPNVRKEIDTYLKEPICSWYCKHCSKLREDLNIDKKYNYLY